MYILEVNSQIIMDFTYLFKHEKLFRLRLLSSDVNVKLNLILLINLEHFFFIGRSLCAKLKNILCTKRGGTVFFTRC